MANSNPNMKNLIPLQDRDPKERAEIARKGGQARQEQVKRRKSLREELEVLMMDGDRQTRISTALVSAAEAGNVSAFCALRDTLGEKPRTEVSADFIGVRFNSVNEMTEEQLEIARRYMIPTEAEIQSGERNPLREMVNRTLSLNARRQLLEEMLEAPKQ